jgi:hypothetical protein
MWRRSLEGQTPMATPGQLERRAFYALRPGGRRDLLTLLHPPYTAWHLSYVAIGAAVAPRLDGHRLLWTLLAFLLAVGVAAHALDELHGRPLETSISDRVLIALTAISLAGAVAIGVVGAVSISYWLLAFVVVGVLLVLAYNLELLGGRMHSDLWFAFAWGAFPALTAFFVQAQELRIGGVLVAGACMLLSLAQRRLSTPVRELRRRTTSLSGEQHLTDGRTVELDSARIAAPMEGALIACAAAMILLAAGLVAARL